MRRLLMPILIAVIPILSIIPAHAELPDDGATFEYFSDPTAISGSLGDSCENCIPVGEGVFSGSTLDNTVEPDITSCALNDIVTEWYCYTATCDGTVTVDTCSEVTDFDTTLSAFDACDGGQIVCNDDACFGFNSKISFAVVAGVTYYVRVSGYNGGVGEFELSIIECNAECGPGNGDCCEANGSPGCNDADCCVIVCDLDPYCCDNIWDGICAGEAEEFCDDLCGTNNPACNEDAGNCCTANGTPGCTDIECCEAVCAIDPFCCDTEWDDICANQALFVVLCLKHCFGHCDCPFGSIPEDETCGDDNNGGCKSLTPVFTQATCGDTFCASAWAAGGTRDTDWYIVTVDDPDGDGFTVINGIMYSEFDGVCYIVDGIDSCSPVVVGTIGIANNCGIETIASAVVAAPGTYVVFVATADFDKVPCNLYGLSITCEEANVPTECNANAGDCCEANGTPGCNDADCCSLICELDPFCCDNSWSVICVEEAANLCDICSPQSELIWFTDNAEFVKFNAGEGNVIKGIEDYDESILPPNNVDTFDDSLESGVPNLPDGFPFPVGMTGLPNLIVQSNLGGGNPINENPRSANGLAMVTQGFLDAASDIVLANTFPDSLDLIFTEEKSGVGFNTVILLGGTSLQVRVYSASNVFLGMMTTPADQSGTNFIGVWSPQPIGRINIFDPSPNSGSEAADRIQAWEEESCPWDLDASGTVGTNDLLLLFAQWGTAGSADFNGSGTVNTSDLLILFANWGPCP